MLLPLFHVCVAVLNTYSLWYDLNYVDMPFPNQEVANLPLKARPMFLTIWCLIIQTIYFSVALLNDIFGTNEPSPKKKPTIRAIKDAMFSVAFPLATYVATTFWSLYIADRELVFPKVLDKVFPPWLNHVMHTMVFIFMLIELVACSRKYLSTRIGFSILFLVNIAYVSCLFAIFLSTGVWVYPLFNVLSWPMKIGFLIANVFFVFFVFVSCKKLDSVATSVKLGIKDKKIK